EDRTAPAQITWDGGPTGNGTDWLNPVNWNYRDPQGQDHDALPGPGDDASIGGTGTNPVILLNGNAAVHSVNSNRVVRITGGALALGAATSSFSNLTLAGGTLDPADGAALANSTINGPTALTIPAGRTLTLQA